MLYICKFPASAAGVYCTSTHGVLCILHPWCLLYPKLTGKPRPPILEYNVSSTLGANRILHPGSTHGTARENRIIHPWEVHCVLHPRSTYSTVQPCSTMKEGRCSTSGAGGERSRRSGLLLLLPVVLRRVPAAGLDPRSRMHHPLQLPEKAPFGAALVQDRVPEPAHDAVVALEGRSVVRPMCLARHQDSRFLHPPTCMVTGTTRTPASCPRPSCVVTGTPRTPASCSSTVARLYA